MKVLVFLLALTTSVLAQQQPSPEFLNNALNAMEGQRNRALNEALTAEAQLAQAQKTIADLQKQLKEKDEPKKE